MKMQFQKCDRLKVGFDVKWTKVSTGTVNNLLVLITYILNNWSIFVTVPIPMTSYPSSLAIEEPRLSVTAFRISTTIGDSSSSFEGDTVFHARMLSLSNMSEITRFLTPLKTISCPFLSSQGTTRSRILPNPSFERKDSTILKSSIPSLSRCPQRKSTCHSTFKSFHTPHLCRA